MKNQIKPFSINNLKEVTSQLKELVNTEITPISKEYINSILLINKSESFNNTWNKYVDSVLLGKNYNEIIDIKAGIRIYEEIVTLMLVVTSQ